MKVLSLLLLAVSVLSSSYPGIRTSLTINSLTAYVKDILPNVISECKSTTIPPITFWVRPLFIPVKIQLSNFEIQDFTVDVSKTFISVNNATKELYLTLSNVDLFLSAEYAYYVPFKVGGNFNLTLTNSTVIIPISIEVSKQKTLYVNVNSLLGDTSSLDIEIEPQGFVSKTFMILTKLWPLSRITSHAMNNMFNRLSTMLNPYVNKYLNGMKYSDQVGNLAISGDYHFLMMNLDPLFIESYINGTFFLNNHLSADSPVVPSSLLPNYFSMSSVRVQITEYYFDSLMWALYQSNTLQMYIKSQDIPSNFPYIFTTTGFSKVAPSLVTVYGPNVPINLECSVYKIPNIDIQKTVSLSASVACNFLVQITPNDVQNAFTVLSTFQTNLIARLVQTNEQIFVVGSLDRTNTLFGDFSVVNSKVGTVNLAKISAAFNWYTYYLVNNVNNVLEDDGLLVPLPKGVVFKNAAFYIYPGAVEIGFEPVYP